jgi:hypothetical protein
MKKMIRNKKFRVAALISFLTTTFLIGIFFSKVIFTPTHVAEAIIDGRELPESAFPNVARLISLEDRNVSNEDSTDKILNDYYKTFCTGTLIGSRYVLTAAHCLSDYITKEIRFVSSDQIRVRLNGVDYQSKAFYIHPTYIPNAFGVGVDAAIIELSTDVKNNRPATLNTKVVSVGTELVFAGYGTLAHEDTHAEPIPYEDKRFPPIGVIHSGEDILDGYDTPPGLNQSISKSDFFWHKFDGNYCESNIGHGDSGGPVFSNTIVVAGINSYGQGPNAKICGIDTKYYAVRVDKIVPWINGILSGKTKPTFFKLTKLDPICNNTPVDTFIFKKPIELNYSNKTNNYCIALGPHPNLVDDGRYDMKTAFGIYTNYNISALYTLKSLVNSIVLKVKKQGSSDYIGQLDRVLGSSEYTDITGYKNIPPITLSKSENNSSQLSEFYNPGGYTIEAWYDGKKISSDDICLESIASPTGNKIGNVVCGDGANSGKVISGSSPLDSDTTITETQTITYESAGLQQFTASSERYPGISMNGSLTPTIEGEDLSISGSFTYNYDTSAVAAITRGGTLSFHLIDADNHTSQIIPVDVVAASEIPEYNKPYFFSPGFDNYIKFLDEDGKPVTTERKAPFSLVITDDGLGMVSAKIPVVDAVTSTTIAGVSQNGAFSGATQSGQAASGTTTPQSGITPAAANGAKATFNVTSAVFDEKTGTIQIDGSVTYSKTTAGTTPTAKNILATVYSSTGTQLQSDLAKITGNNFSIAFKSMDVAKAPFEFTLKDADLNVASPNKFKVASAAASTPDPTKDPKPSFGLFQNPLRKGLDSIPEIVSALVKNIVIPIAVPFLALAIIYTGFLFIQARGNKDKLEKAKEALKWTLIGGAIILAAYVIATALQGTIADIIR